MKSENFFKRTPLLAYLYFEFLYSLRNLSVYVFRKMNTNLHDMYIRFVFFFLLYLWEITTLYHLYEGITRKFSKILKKVRSYDYDFNRNVDFSVLIYLKQQTEIINSLTHTRTPYTSSHPVPVNWVETF